MKFAMLPINALQLDVSAFQTGELACNFLMYAKTLFASGSFK